MIVAVVLPSLRITGFGVKIEVIGFVGIGGEVGSSSIAGMMIGLRCVCISDK